MENLNVFVGGDNQVNQEKPPPRVCPRCNSSNTKFCYYNNYSRSQPRYNCRNCRRTWTHGGALRNIPVGGSGRTIQRARIDQPSVSQVVSVEIQQVSVQVYHHQPFLHVQGTNAFAGFLRGSSSSSPLVSVGNRFGSLPGIHGDMVLPSRSFRPMDRSGFHDGSFQQGYYDVRSNDLIGNPLINQSFGGSTVVGSEHNGYRNQEDQNRWSPSFNNMMNTNHNASTSGSRGSAGPDHINTNNGIIRNNSVFRSCYHLEKHGRP